MPHQSRTPASIARIGFVTLPNYSMIAFANAVEAGRMANYVAGTPVYSWTVITPSADPVSASNGLGVDPALSLSEAVADPQGFDLVLVCGGIDVRHGVDRRLRDALRSFSRSGAALGALCTGSFALADCGLLDGYRCAIHWENLSAIREEFPDIDFTDDLFVIDRDRLTCTGGVAPLDMMTTLIDARLGRRVATRVAEQFVLDRLRVEGERQNPAKPQRSRHTDPAVAQAVKLMERRIEAPMPLAEMADQIGTSLRQLERLFHREMKTSPVRYYLDLRLSRAREFLRQTDMKVTDIAIASGFQSPAHFATAYTRRFGHSPRVERAR